MDKDLQSKSVLLGLPLRNGYHTGEALRGHVIKLLNDYLIVAKVVYFMADNAANNERAIKLLEADLDTNACEQRLRCSGHIYNLVVKAMLDGADKDCFDKTCRDGADLDELEDSEVVKGF